MILKDVLRPDLYVHFFSLAIAISILVTDRLTQVEGNIQFALELLTYVVSRGRQLYGPTFEIFNVHSMIHLAADASRFGSSEKCSAWKYENFLRKLRDKVKGSVPNSTNGKMII